MTHGTLEADSGMQPALEGAIPDELADTLEGLERALSELESLSASP